MVGRLSVAIALVLTLAGCAGGATDRAHERVPRSPLWVRATPQQEGIDLSALDRADLKGITSLLIARHGKLVAERYYGGLQATDRVPVFSITKTVVSALTGIAIAEGRIRGVDERLAHFVHSAPRSITLRQLLTMTAGYGRSFNFQDTNAATLANRSLANDPGTTFVYDSGSSDLLAAVLARATGMSAAEYARRRLFGPMGISDEHWPSSRGGSGLVLRPRDLLAFGQMYLDAGTWNGRRIVPAAWVRASTRAQVDVGPDQGISDAYGYNWWVDDRRLHSFAAHGYLGQALVILPRLDEVVLVTSSREDGRTFGLVRLVVRATR
jgi:CubicO group peptidase (beta-lactamase class C family)